MDNGKPNFETMESKRRQMGKTNEHVFSVYNLPDSAARFNS